MDIMSFIGMIGSFGLIVWGIGLEQLGNFIDTGSILITVGGTFTALMITFPLKVFASLPKMLLKIFIPQKFNPYSYIVQIVEIASEVRKQGIMALDDKIPEYKDEFLKKGLTLAVDAIDVDEIRDIMESEIVFMMERHKAGLGFFEKGAALAPGFGMIGTLIGLVNMLVAMASDNSGGSEDLMYNMGIALITTFYGSVMANVLFLPMGNKLKQRSDEEVLCKQIVVEGVISIASAENPNKIKEKLLSYIPPAMRTEKGEKKANDATPEQEEE